jgi:hypothetical protein
MSPRAWSSRFERWNFMLSTGLLLSALDPVVEVSSIIYQGGAFTLYLMINWLPSEASGFVDLERVHSTLGRYRFRAAPGLPFSRVMF